MADLDRILFGICQIRIFLVKILWEYLLCTNRRFFQIDVITCQRTEDQRNNQCMQGADPQCNLLDKCPGVVLPLSPKKDMCNKE